MTVIAASLEALPLWALLLVLAVGLLSLAIVLAAVTGALGSVIDNSLFSGEPDE